MQYVSVEFCLFLYKICAHIREVIVLREILCGYIQGQINTRKAMMVISTGFTFICHNFVELKITVLLGPDFS